MIDTIDTLADGAIAALDTAAEIWRLMEIGFDAEADWITLVLVLTAVFLWAYWIAVRRSW